MLIVTGTIDISPEGVDSMIPAAVVMAKATRTEEGCITYGFWQDLEMPNRFRVYEEWESLAALEAHFTAPHMAVFREVVGKAGVISRDIVRFDRGEVTPL